MINIMTYLETWFQHFQDPRATQRQLWSCCLPRAVRLGVMEPRRPKLERWFQAPAVRYLIDLGS